MEKEGENERWKGSIKKIPTTEQVQIVLTMLQSFEWCGFLATFSSSFGGSFFSRWMYFEHTHTHTHIVTIRKESNVQNEK